MQNEHFKIYLNEIDNENSKLIQNLITRNLIQSEDRDEAGNNALHLALIHKKPDIAWFLIKRGWTLTDLNKSKKTPLHYAASRGLLDIVQYICEETKNLTPITENGLSPLHLAAYENKVEVIDYFLTQGVDPDIRNKKSHQRSPLHFAAYNGYQDAIEKLLQYGADSQLKDDKGKTPAHYAKENGFKHILPLLR